MCYELSQSRHESHLKIGDKPVQLVVLKYEDPKLKKKRRNTIGDVLMLQGTRKHREPKPYHYDTGPTAQYLCTNMPHLLPK